MLASVTSYGYCVSMLTRSSRVDPSRFRTVLGRFPTGVVAITSRDEDGSPVGMAVSSFTSVSLEPPLVAFLPARASTTFPAIARSGTFCVNVLAADQEALCHALAASGGDKFAGVAWRPGPHGDPEIDGAVAWLGCTIEAVHDAGDHHIVVSRVDDLASGAAEAPLLFFRSRYHRLAAA